MKQKTSKWTRKNGFVNKVRDLLSRYERKPSKFAIEEENSFCNKEFSGSEKRLDEVTQSSVDINWVVRRENFIAQLDTIVKNLSKILEAQQDLVELIKQIRLCSKEIASIYISLKNLTEGNPSILRDRGSDLKLLQKYIVEMVTSLNHYKQFTSWVKIDPTNNPFLMPFNVFGQYSLVGLVDHISIDMKPWQYSNDLFVSIPASLMVTATQFLEFHKLSEAVKELYLSWNDEQFFMDKRLHRARILLNRSQKAIDKDPVLRYLLSAESNDRTILDEKGKIQKVSDMKFLSFSAANVKRAYIGWRISFFRKVSLRRVCQIRAAIVSRQVLKELRSHCRLCRSASSLRRRRRKFLLYWALEQWVDVYSRKIIFERLRRKNVLQRERYYFSEWIHFTENEFENRKFRRRKELNLLIATLRGFKLNLLLERYLRTKIERSSLAMKCLLRRTFKGWLGFIATAKGCKAVDRLFCSVVLSRAFQTLLLAGAVNNNTASRKAELHDKSTIPDDALKEDEDNT